MIGEKKKKKESGTMGEMGKFEGVPKDKENKQGGIAGEKAKMNRERFIR